MGKKLYHLGVIMDGNRRWAKGKGLLKVKGHNEGAKAFEQLSEWCNDAGIPFLTVFAFSTENWQRDKNEINDIFKLMKQYFKKDKERCIQENIRLKIIGDRIRLAAHDKEIISVIEDVEKATKNNTGLTIQIALSYGGRDEIIRAVRKICDDAITGKVKAEEITESLFEKYLDSDGVPNVDLVIRTGGNDNMRMSGFLPWQTVYAELYFSQLLWPDFNKEEFTKAVDYYYNTEPKKGR